MAAPRKIALSDLSNALPTVIHTFICCASYEQRSLSIPLSVRPDQVQEAIICFNDDFAESVGANHSTLMSHFGSRSRGVTLRQSEPMYGMDHLQEALPNDLDSPPRTVVVDSTTFTHEGLLTLFRLLASYLRLTDVLHIVYTPASDYAFNSADPEKWLSRGLKEIRSVLGFPGRLVPGRRLHLVVLVGFEVERARLLIDACEADVVSLGSGRDATDSKQAHLPRNTESLRQLSVLYPRFRKFEFSSVDPVDTDQVLAEQVSQFPDHNTIIAPMNTKLSTIGAALFALRNRQIQLCYAPAITYNIPAYSRPHDFCLAIELPVPLPNPD
jgi:hypothetical protein